MNQSYNLTKSVLVTGAAGFIGFHLTQKLLDRGARVIGFDNMDTYYDANLKYCRLRILRSNPNFTFVKGNLVHKRDIDKLFSRDRPQFVIHLAAQAGVPGGVCPGDCLENNVNGFMNLLEACRQHPPEHLLYASSFSVYGGRNEALRSAEETCRPVSVYAASKKSNELMAYTYSHLYDIPSTGLRLFSVYGPFGRPDMAYFSFTQKILKDEPIELFNHGDIYRNYTYIDDVAAGIELLLFRPPRPNGDGVRAKVYNLGHHKPVKLTDFVGALERCLGKTAVKTFLPMQPGDVYGVRADLSGLMTNFGFQPVTPLEEGLSQFVAWYQDFYAETGQQRIKSLRGS